MSEWISVAEIFGENVFNDAVMQERLPKKTYKELKKKVKSFRLQQQTLLHMR
jgi:glutamine synthetase